MRDNRPVIGITKSVDRGFISWLCLSFTLRFMGAVPVKLTVAHPYQNIDFDGLILSGGTDIFPDWYSGTVKKDYIYDHARDEMEVSLLQKAEHAGKPVLGICRGAQLINIHRKGSLHFDVSKAYEKAEYPNSTLANIFYRKRMYLEGKDSLLYKLLRCKSCRVNSIHTQSVNRIGQGLVISGHEKNGVVQAIEDQSRPYFLGVQFHPEYLVYQKRFRRIFRQFIDLAAKNRR
ncbi:MAG: gamma-glutamyl-gamma-aminobutyrate hydrolase family protein [Pseudomonadota bacterium]